MALRPSNQPDESNIITNKQNWGGRKKNAVAWKRGPHSFFLLGFPPKNGVERKHRVDRALPVREPVTTVRCYKALRWFNPKRPPPSSYSRNHLSNTSIVLLLPLFPGHFILLCFHDWIFSLKSPQGTIRNHTLAAHSHIILSTAVYNWQLNRMQRTFRVCNQQLQTSTINRDM